MVRCKKSLDFYCAVHILRASTLAAVHVAANIQGLKMTTAPNLEAFQDFSKQQIEAFTAASATLTKGLQEIAAESTDYSKKAFAAGSAVVEKLLGARSVEAAVQIQSEYAKQAYEGFVAQSSKFSELYAKVASDALKPVTSAYSNLQVK
jgi:hypothetical protein